MEDDYMPKYVIDPSNLHLKGYFRKKGIHFDPLQVYAGKKNLFSIKLHHGGKFTASPKRMYVGGKVNYVDNIDVDLFNVDEVHMFVQDLGYDPKQLMFYHFKLANKSLDYSLRPLSCDVDVPSVEIEVLDDDVELNLSVVGSSKSQMITVVSVDANNGIYPVAYGIVKSESKDSWTMFIQCPSRDDFYLYANSNFTFITDRQNVYYQLLQDLLSAADTDKQLLEARDSPVITALEYVREYLMKRIVIVQKVNEGRQNQVVVNLANEELHLKEIRKRLYKPCKHADDEQDSDEENKQDSLKDEQGRGDDREDFIVDKEHVIDEVEVNIFLDFDSFYSDVGDDTASIKKRNLRKLRKTGDQSCAIVNTIFMGQEFHNKELAKAIIKAHAVETRR
ncbi:transposase, MuDR [Tanacetum coccineum]